MSKLASQMPLLALLLMPFQSAMADSIFKVPFEYAEGRNSILISVQINEKPVLLIFDPGSSKTVICAEAVGPGRDAFAGNSMDQEVTLQIGSRKWQKRKIVVMDPSQARSVCQKRIDGILGLDILKEFSQVIISIKDQTLTFVEENGTASGRSPVPDKSAGHLSFGNLRRLELKQSGGSCILNGIEMNRVSGPLTLETAEEPIRVRVSFLATVRVSRSWPVDRAQEALISEWVERIPLVANILKDQDPIGSLKPVVYDLIETKRQDLELQEELVLLWSGDPAEDASIGNTSLLPPVAFHGEIVDVQYRGLKTASDRLFGRIILQVLYIRDHARHFLLGGFVIVSKPNGKFEFYRVPKELLDKIVE